MRNRLRQFRGWVRRIRTSRHNPIPHGRARYQRGCRCDECRADNARAWREYRDKAHHTAVPHHVHGSASGYSYWGCRCPSCKAVKAHQDAKRRAS